MKKILTFKQHINESEQQDVIYMAPADKPSLKAYNEKRAIVVSDDGDTLTIKFEDGKTLTVVPKTQVRYLGPVEEAAETLLPDVSDERISKVWSGAIGGNQPTLDKMRKDILDLMKREKLSFTEIEIEVENNNNDW